MLRHSIKIKLYFVLAVFAFSASSPITLAETLRSSEKDLLAACESGDWKAVDRILQSKDSSVTATQPDGMTALHWAAFHGQIDVVKQLIQRKAKVDAANRYGLTPLSLACQAAHTKVVSALIKAGADPRLEIPGGITPLMLSARVGDADSVRNLIRAGVNVDEGERKSQTALMWAAAEGNVEAVQELIDGGADLNNSIKSGFNAMMFAVREGHLPVVETLLGAGVDINETMKPRNSGARVPRSGTSALHMAVESGHFQLAMYLVENGADPNDQRCGFAPLHIVTWVRKPNRGEGTDGDPAPRGSGNMTSMQFVRAIVAAGADVNLRLKKGKTGKAFLGHKGATPILLAGKTADLELIRTLVELGADPLAANDENCTPFMACAGVGVRAVGEEAGTEPEVIETLEYLLSKGADVNTVDKNKETAMHGAAYRCYPKVIDFLAANGANPKIWDHKNRSGWTPIMIGHGHRPGSLKPSPPTVAALERAKVNFKKLDGDN